LKKKNERENFRMDGGETVRGRDFSSGGQVEGLANGVKREGGSHPHERKFCFLDKGKKLSIREGRVVTGSMSKQMGGGKGVSYFHGYIHTGEKKIQDVPGNRVWGKGRGKKKRPSPQKIFVNSTPGGK